MSDAPATAPIATPRKGGPPSDAEIKQARAAAASAANLAKARDAKAAKAAAEKAAEKLETPEAEKGQDSLGLEDGARLLVRALWAVSGLAALIVGGRLDKLTDEEVSAGAQEALPLLRRLRWLGALLGWVGLPFWLAKNIAAKFSSAKKPAAAPPTPPKAP